MVRPLLPAQGGEGGGGRKGTRGNPEAKQNQEGRGKKDPYAGMYG